MSKPQAGKAVIATKKIIKGPNGEILVTVESLDDVIRNSRKITSQKNFVPGNAIYDPGVATLKGFLKVAVDITTTLINDNNLDTDKYNLLSCKTKSFGSHNDLCNELLKEIKEERKVDAEIKKEVNPEDPENNKPFTEEQVANIQANPKLSDPESHEVEETTQDGGRMKFDKVAFTITVYLDNGTAKVIQLAPEGSWRQTVAKWLIIFFDSVAVAVNTVKETFKTGFNRFTGLFKKKVEEKKPEAKVNDNHEVVPNEDVKPSEEPAPAEQVDTPVETDEVEQLPESTTEKSTDTK